MSNGFSEQWIFDANDKISSIEWERSISGARDLRFHEKVLWLAPAAVSNGVSKSLVMAILGCKTHVHLCPANYNRRGRLQLLGRMQAHGSNMCSKEQTKTWY